MILVKRCEMDKKTFKNFLLGLSLAVGSAIGLTACENKNENQDDNMDHKTETNEYKIGQAVLESIPFPGVKEASSQNAPDSILTGVDFNIEKNRAHYTNPRYSAIGERDPEKVRVNAKDSVLEFTYDKKTKEDIIKEAKERIEKGKEKWTIEKWSIESHNSSNSSASNVQTSYVLEHYDEQKAFSHGDTTIVFSSPSVTSERELISSKSDQETSNSGKKSNTFNAALYKQKSAQKRHQ